MMYRNTATAILLACLAVMAGSVSLAQAAPAAASAAPVKLLVAFYPDHFPCDIELGYYDKTPIEITSGECLQVPGTTHVNFARDFTASTRVYLVESPPTTPERPKVQFFTDANCQSASYSINLESDDEFACVTNASLPYSFGFVHLGNDKVALLGECNSNCDNCEFNAIGSFDECQTAQGKYFMVAKKSAAGLLQVPTLFAMLSASLVAMFMSKML
ncbi:hypothetical protein CAOG_02192 [Capsaspora owczarzaki ATCC 30864]|uniref:Uncharacterized protein n=1 Tax=Capsaspora owczarzaki (strain ATCC 30864) TaxID=595528 RepID=A0A0D2VLI3_CAPO3|nr:hypothetical protein CAOG_02192 [Capsaspora owczarzaki ATCC 30864]KJE90977.1 hypothetical protein CAOG_002192 [Capsaspora owczarzaki ATCC 30864]|eukprot:XP_004348942.1 hypothetical protein CAOG_02192 [Capsaspora owczarzaki ATCC 30864]